MSQTGELCIASVHDPMTDSTIAVKLWKDKMDITGEQHLNTTVMIIDLIVTQFGVLNQLSPTPSTEKVNQEINKRTPVYKAATFIKHLTSS